MRGLQAARKPPDERERLADLRAHAVLGSEPERDFDALVEEASRLCEAPIALVSLLDEDRQWFKARVGLEPRETPRDLAFCGHAILESGLFEVPDAAQDGRFADNPLVTGEPNIRFYAGVPLRSAAGHALGTLCVIDRVPRTLDAAQRVGLQALGERVTDELEARRRLRALALPDPAATAMRPVAAYDPTAQTLQSSLQRVTLPGDEPRRCGRFTIRERIGQGAMATVYAAHDAELDRDVAIKLLRGDGDEDSRLRVQREAQALARVSHPNVVQIHEIGSYGTQVFVAMELVDGVPLSAWRRAQPRSLGEIVAMYLQAGRGLIAAHSVGIIHRDFKADNVLVGSDGRARVADFGLARVLSAGPEVTIRERASGERAIARTEAGMIMGTPAYMSPEQHRSAAVDERSDQFNYCAAFYEAIYEVRPFAGRTVDELAAQVAAGLVEPPPEPGMAPPGLHRALLRGLEPDPAARWPSLAALLEHLERFARASDPASERQRRGFTGTLVVLVTVIAAGQVYGALVMPTAVTVGLEVAVSAGVLAVGLIATALVRKTLLTEPVHRRMLGMMLFAMATGLVSRGLCALAGLPLATLQLVDLIALAVGLAALALFVAPGLRSLAAVALAGALVQGVFAVPAMIVAAVVQSSTVLLFARAWRRAATLE